jgi:hypothetical protein
MAMEYYIDANCEMCKTAGGMDALRQYIKKRGIVQTMFNIIAQHDPTADVLSQKTVYEQSTPEGVKKTEATVGQLKAETDWMDQWADHCAQCQYAFMLDDKGEKHELCGCYSSISYPLSNISERMVSEALNIACQQDKGHPFHKIVDYILEKNVTGEPVNALRKRGLMERDKTIPSKVSTFKKITTDQALEVLFFHPKTPEVANDVLRPLLGIMMQMFSQSDPNTKQIILNDRCAFYLMGMGSALKKAGEVGKTLVTIP